MNRPGLKACVSGIPAAAGTGLDTSGTDLLDVLYLADIRFPLERANGIQIFETCHALASRGHRVTLLVRDDTRRPRRDPFEFYGLPAIATLRVERLPMAGPYALRRIAYMVAAVWHAWRWNWARGCVLTRDLGVASAVLRLPVMSRPKLVYESHGFAPVFARTMPELVQGKVAGGHAKIERLFRREERIWLGADGYVTTTGVLATELRTRFGDRPSLVTMSNGVRLPANRVRTPTSNAGPTVVGYAGHFYRWKGVDVLVEALGQLQDVHALIIGGHPGEPDVARVTALAQKVGAGSRITFTGLVEPSRVPSLLGRAHILVLPTVDTASAAYTSPLKLFEYFAAGKPVLASDLPPIREIVRDGENGVLFAAGDPQSLVQAIRRVQHDDALAERLARTAFAEADRYSWRTRAERLEAFLLRVVTTGFKTRSRGRGQAAREGLETVPDEELDPSRDAG
jgi:glycosyltransferase involved in cell wall biosynthesis